MTPTPSARPLKFSDQRKDGKESPILYSILKEPFKTRESQSVGLSVWAVLVSISFWWKRTKGVRYLCSPDAWIGWNWTEFWIHSIQPFFPYENRNRIEKLKVLWLGYNLCPEWNQISRSFMNFLIEVRRYVRLGNWHVPNWTLLRKSSLRKCGIRTVPCKRKALALLRWLTLGQRSWAYVSNLEKIDHVNLFFN